MPKRKEASSPAPAEYEIPLSSTAYATVQNTSSRSGDGGPKDNGGYASIDPHSLDEPSYYKATRKGLPEPDEGGVHTYLEVVPAVPSHRSSPGLSRTGSPKRPTNLGTSSTPQQKPQENVASPDVPDVLEGDSIEMYEYINADLGPM